MLKNIRLSAKLASAFVILSVFSAFIIGTLVLRSTAQVNETGALNKISSMTRIFQYEISDQLNEYKSHLLILSRNFSIHQSITEFDNAFNDLSSRPRGAEGYLDGIYRAGNPYPLGQRQQLMNANDGSLYSTRHDRWHKFYDMLVQQVDLYDVFLINTDGDIIYTWAKEADFATNLNSGRWSDTDLARVFREAMTMPKGQDIAATTFKPYEPSAGALAGFMAVPVFDENNNRIGVLAAQASLDIFLNILSRDTGLGVDTQTFLLNGSARTVIAAGPGSTDFAPDYWAGQTNITESLFKTANAVNADVLSVNNSDVILGRGNLQTDGLNYGIILQASYDDLMQETDAMKRTVLIIGAVVAVVFGSIGVVFSRRIALPLIRVSEQLDELAADRNLTLRLSQDAGSDEIGNAARSVDRLISFFDASMSQIRKGSEQLVNTTLKVEDAVQALARDSEVQSSAVEELSASVEETSQQVEINAEAAMKANTVVMETNDVVLQGTRKIARMVESMDAINKSSRDIAAIIKVIDEIAFQTNLLALNAAVEAARAGQHGRGFAVVAQEVRNLAGRSAKAARETAALIDGSRVRVEEGVSISEETRSAFDEIASNIEAVRGRVNEISAASKEQALGMKQINEAINEIATVTRNNSTKAEDLAATSTYLANTNKDLQKELSRFDLSGA